MNIKLSYIFQHEETGRFCAIVFDYAQIFNGECKAMCEKLTGYMIVAARMFTGLKDKNDKEIYEGDIMKYNVPDCVPDEDEQTYTEYTEEVVYEDGMFTLEVMPVFAAKYDGEVIGNIYENTELLTTK